MPIFFSSNRGRPVKVKLFTLLLLINLPVSNEHKSIATSDNKHCYKDLSKTSSGQASRYTLAFFVPSICTAPQAKQITSTTPIHSLAFKTLMGNTVYDGLMLQNKRALRRICGAVANKTESELRHLILSVLNTVAPTHYLLGGSYHD